MCGNYSTKNKNKMQGSQISNKKIKRLRHRRFEPMFIPLRYVQLDALPTTLSRLLSWMGEINNLIISGIKNGKRLFPNRVFERFNQSLMLLKKNIGLWL